ncbi:Lsa family ABC-F type ribosomal protection protein [Bacillus pseudomycoides]|uniref:Lsa family ABC-F type ribosomal protection protein n=9 Tax=Bacillus pseudomycoides TaxID=64104 RepID=A0AAJ1Z7P0_9BACI|nr:Lsa family ABC-F type ribosomal protection protein [Bacillus pseudomycoides]MCR8859546.1 Lsa family ABC-F type ribosomal protection protein [Bacillus pseudomycoides]MDR4185721.1 Lsa family ABC-F type ribosomal protection protein [Bacillus pseudomycoides]MDR4327891.1 Lsa family ABC-F type ribosomal protection protein [Bacillus pseudomycoides]MED0856724.1 Lsa family ABC-F type ribosomal protection protein [Bacillus pseudomycoides]MED1624258.1 Lsa family ABC-F type ribosomal protection protein
MSMIKVQDLTFSYPGSFDNIFEGVNFQIDTDWKLGFIGRNGRGKTTFFNLLLGNYEYSGKITSSVEFNYFPYPVSDKNKFTHEILEEICPQAEDWEFLREISYLNVDAEAMYRPFKTLSNGEQTKVLLAALFLNEGQFLLIDEPTNHLDTDARKMVSDYLRRKKGFILISHDRIFLDGCVDHILSINRANIEVQSGNYSSWKLNFDRQQEHEEATNERLQKDIGRLKQSSKRSAGWSHQVEASKNGTRNSGSKLDKGFVGHKAAKMMKRTKNLESRQQKAIEEKSKLLKNVEKTESLKLEQLKFQSNELVVLADVSVKYDDQIVNEPISFIVEQGDRIVLDGKNGSGKSSILKLILGHPIQHTGSVNLGSGLIISYVQQDTSHLKGSLSDFIEEHEIDETLFKSILRKMDFDRIQFEKDIFHYSGGQKKKLLIAKSLCEKTHLYIWDEPLNFIDIYSRMQIEELIQQFNPTMVIVEHDKAFQQTVATKTISI